MGRLKEWIIIGAFVLACLFFAGLGTSVQADEAHSNVAGSGDTAGSMDVVKPGMTPIYGSVIKDGSYKIDVSSSSYFFSVDDCLLTVKDGKMEAKMTLSSHSYLLLYLGTGKEAAAAPAEDYVDFTDENGRCTFTIPVEALNAGIDCAAFSKNRSKWYDRVLVFEAASLPAEALPFELPDYSKIEKAMKAYESTETTEEGKKEEKTTQADSSDTSAEAWEAAEAMDVGIKDGEYSIEVNMTGGSGRASISSPTLLKVKDGRAYGKLIWSSTYYDYMIVGGKKFLNETKDGGNSVFTIPISAMDQVIPVIADTTAMGDPVEISYSLTFYEGSIGDKGLIPQEAAKKVLIFALIIIVVGAIINHFVKKKRKGR